MLKLSQTAGMHQLHLELPDENLSRRAVGIINRCRWHLGTELEATSRFSSMHLNGFTVIFRDHLNHTRNIRHHIPDKPASLRLDEDTPYDTLDSTFFYEPGQGLVDSSARSQL